jgi:hypothetical protein
MALADSRDGWSGPREVIAESVESLGPRTRETLGFREGRSARFDHAVGTVSGSRGMRASQRGSLGLVESVEMDDKQQPRLAVLLVDVAVGKKGVLESRVWCAGERPLGLEGAGLVRGLGGGGGCPVVVELEQVVARAKQSPLRPDGRSSAA